MQNANDGESLNLIDEIVLPYIQHKSIFHIPKLFFIDTCWGCEEFDKVTGMGTCKNVGGKYQTTPLPLGTFPMPEPMEAYGCQNSPKH